MNERLHDVTPKGMLLDVSVSTKNLKKYNKIRILINLDFSKINLSNGWTEFAISFVKVNIIYPAQFNTLKFYCICHTE